MFENYSAENAPDFTQTNTLIRRAKPSSHRISDIKGNMQNL